MLYQLGVLSIKVHPFNVNKVQGDASTDYVPKPVLGAEPPMEYVGEGANTWRLSGDLFPKVIGGLNELQLLHSMRSSGRPQFLLRGDGTPLGWVVIEKVSTREEHLGGDGVGQKISVDIEVRRAGRPSRLALFTILLGLFT
jgi:phage protein U